MTRPLYEIRTCICGLTDEEALERGIKFWLYEGGARCEACLAKEADE